ncbi:MAG: TlpA disulfide reductase family protein [Rubrivivax sp.]
MTRRSVLGGMTGVGTLGALCALGAPPATATEPGSRVAWPEVALLDGSRLVPAQWTAGSAVVVFWSTTCPFCRRHNQHVEKLHRAARAAAAAGQAAPRVLSVARDRDADVVRRYVQAQGYSFPVTMAYAELAKATSQRNMIPLTVTVDRAGRLRQAIPGEMFEEDVMELMALAAA